MIEKLKTAIVDIIKNLDLDGADAFSNVYDAITEDFEGSPSAVVTFETSDAEIFTTTLNKRTYEFNIGVWYSYNPKILSQSDVNEIVNNLVDLTVNAVEHDATLNGLIAIMNPVFVDEKEVLNSGEGLAIYQNLIVSMVLLE